MSRRGNNNRRRPRTSQLFPEHSKAAIAATLSSGIRSVFCYCPTPRLNSWDPFKINMDFLPRWVMSTLEELVVHKSLVDSRIQLGIAFDGAWLPKEVTVNLFNKVKSLGIKVITAHYVHNASSRLPHPLILTPLN
jgi:hypothetical protein